jgi:hypothetical protein
MTHPRTFQRTLGGFLSLAFLFAGIRVTEAVSPERIRRFSQDHMADSHCALLLDEIAAGNIASSHYLRMPPLSERVNLGVLVETDKGYLILASTDFLGQHNQVLEVADQAGYGRITKIFWGGELKLANLLAIPAAGKIREANETAGGVFQLVQAHAKSPILGIELIQLSVEDLERMLQEYWPGGLATDFKAKKYEPGSDGINHLVAEFAQMEKQFAFLRSPSENTRHQLNNLLPLLSFYLKAPWADLAIEGRAENHKTVLALFIWIFKNYLEQGTNSEPIKNGVRILSLRLEGQDLTEEDAKILFGYTDESVTVQGSIQALILLLNTPPLVDLIILRAISP